MTRPHVPPVAIPRTVKPISTLTAIKRYAKRNGLPFESVADAVNVESPTFNLRVSLEVRAIAEEANQ